jgi:TRAP transporter TAXI family solute receptor
MEVLFMKSKIAVALTMCFLIVSFPVFAGGGGEASSSANQNAIVDIRCGGGTVGGVFYIMAAAVSTIVNKYVPGVNFTAQTTAGGAESYNRLVKKNMESYIGNCDIVYIGAHGGDPSKPTFVASDNVRTWFCTEASPFLLVARADNNKMTKFEDIWKPGLKVGTQPKGSTTHTMLLSITEYMGQDSSKMNIYTAGHDQSANALKDGNIDMIYAGSGSLSAPNSAYQELASSTKMRMFDYPESLRDKIVTEMPYWGKFTLAPDWLKGYEKPCNVVAVLNSFFLEESVPEDVVYEMTKAVFENLEELKGIAYAPFQSLNPQTAAKNAVVPFHPGALRYYKEKGFDVSFFE